MESVIYFLKKAEAVRIYKLYTENLKWSMNIYIAVTECSVSTAWFCGMECGHFFQCSGLNWNVDDL